jgi:predicted ATP-grasp superfamily ATP-dependent carboligase
MSKSVLLTIGRLPKALDFARSFSALGWRVVVAEPYRTHLTGASNTVAKSVQTPPPSAGKAAYLAALQAIIEAEKIDLVLPLSEETMHVAHLRDQLPKHVQLFAPPSDQLLALHHKALFPKRAAAHGLSVPETAILGTDAAEKLAQTHDYVIKPVYSCSGRGVSLHGAGEALEKGKDFAPDEEAVVQRQLKGQQYSSFTIAHRGGIHAHVIYRGIVMSGSVAVAFERVEQGAIEEWVNRFVAAEHYSGFISFDFFVDDQGQAQAIECNPRVTSGVHFIETEDLAAAILAPFSQPIRMKPAQRMQQFYPTLTEVQAAMFKGPQFWQNLKVLRTAKDVTWRASDPMPFVTMPITAFSIIAMSMREQRSFGQVSTQDISWFEGEALTPMPARLKSGGLHV